MPPPERGGGVGGGGSSGVGPGRFGRAIASPALNGADRTIRTVQSWTSPRQGSGTSGTPGRVMSKSRIAPISITKPQVRGLRVAPKPHYSAVSWLRLLQGRDLAGVLAELSALPGVLELAAVLLGPFGHHALGSRRQTAVRDLEILDAHRGLVAAVLGMEMGRPMVPEVHADHDAVRSGRLQASTASRSRGNSSSGVMPVISR